MPFLVRYFCICQAELYLLGWIPKLEQRRSIVQRRYLLERPIQDILGLVIAIWYVMYARPSIWNAASRVSATISPPIYFTHFQYHMLQIQRELFVSETGFGKAYLLIPGTPHQPTPADASHHNFRHGYLSRVNNASRLHLIPVTQHAHAGQAVLNPCADRASLH